MSEPTVSTTLNEFKRFWIDFFERQGRCHQVVTKRCHLSVLRAVARYTKESEGAKAVWSAVKENEIESVLKEVRWHSAPGLDLVPYRIIQIVHEEKPEWLCQTFDRVAMEEWAPQQWTHSKIAVIPKMKVGKKVDLRNQTNYRPITITSCVLRVFEGVLAARIQKAMHKKLSPVQGGFVRGRGTAEQLFCLREICRKHRDEKKTLILAFLDFRKAFDSVWHEGLLLKLWEQFGVQGKLWRIVKMLLEGNYVRVEIGQIKTEFAKINAGTRQGGKTSPLLFNIFIDDMVEELRETECGVSIGSLVLACLLYADDIVLLARSPDELRSLLKSAEKWARKWRLAFNVGKCKILVVYASQSIRRKLRATKFKLFGETVDVVNTVTYLGMEINARLTLPKTPKKIRETVEKRVNFLRWVSAARKGLRAELILPLFGVLVRPLMTVNGQLAIYSKSGLVSIERTQTMAIKRCLRLPMYTKNETVRIISGILPVEATLDQLYLLFWNKMQSCEVDHLSTLVRLSRLEAGAEIQMEQELGGGWCSRAARLLIKYDCADLWDADYARGTFHKKITQAILAYHRDSELLALKKSRQASLLWNVLDLYDHSTLFETTSGSMLLAQLDHISLPMRGSLLRFICGAVYQNIREKSKSNKLLVQKCPVFDHKWDEPLLHLAGSCSHFSVQRKTWMGDENLVLSWNRLAESMGLGTQFNLQKARKSANFIHIILKSLNSVRG